MADKIKRTSQYIHNESFDETYEQQAVEILVENTAETALVRQKSIATEAKQDPLGGYAPAGMDTTANPYYFGYLKTDGSWYIKKLDTTSGTTYVKGTTGYATNWTGRAGLSYGEFDAVFG